VSIYQSPAAGTPLVVNTSSSVIAAPDLPCEGAHSWKGLSSFDSLVASGVGSLPVRRKLLSAYSSPSGRLLRRVVAVILVASADSSPGSHWSRSSDRNWVDRGALMCPLPCFARLWGMFPSPIVRLPDLSIETRILE